MTSLPKFSMNKESGGSRWEEFGSKEFELLTAPGVVRDMLRGLPGRIANFAARELVVPALRGFNGTVGATREKIERWQEKNGILKFDVGAVIVLKGDTCHEGTVYEVVGFEDGRYLLRHLATETIQAYSKPIIEDNFVLRNLLAD